MDADVKHFIIENTWLPGISHGWGNGYVALPPGHPCHGMGYDEIHDEHEINVHGSLTFSDSADSLKEGGWIIDEQYTGYWIVGFDTAQYQDGPHNWPKEAVENEAKNLAEQFRKIA